MTNILIPTDFSENSWNSIVYTLSFFKDSKCIIYLMHVINTRQNGSSQADETVNQLKMAKEKLQEFIVKIEGQNQGATKRFYPIACSGSIVDCIRKQVEEKEINLIILGTKGESTYQTNPVGSNTTEIIHKVKCTSLVIPENARFHKIDKIALPTDFNIFYSAKLLNTVSEQLERFKASLNVIQLSKNDEKLMGNQLQNKEFLADFFREDPLFFHSVTNKNLDEALQKYIVENDIDIVAMVAKNVHFFQQLFYNVSTNKKDNYHKKIPFLVLHE